MSSFYNSKQSVFRLTNGNSSFINSMMVSGRGKELSTSIALAMYVSGTVSLPGGEIESPETYFDENGATLGTEFLGTLNELVPIDYRCALDIAKRLYLTRYEIAQCPYTAFGVDRRNGVYSVFGLNNHLSPEVLNCLSTHGQVITDLYSRFKDIASELKKD